MTLVRGVMSSMGPDHAEQSFQVDLRGMVDLLSRHLYSSPRVYLRELLQNAADALTARRDAANVPTAPVDGPDVRIIPSDVSADGRLHVVDQGSGLDGDLMRKALATIGASTKRDEIGQARSGYLGQFGIGLLSCLLVADEIEVCSRPRSDGPVWRWTGRSNGTYEITELPPASTDDLTAGTANGHDEPSAPPLPPVGTRVSLRPRPGDASLTKADTVTDLARTYAEMLPITIEVEQPSGGGPSVVRTGAVPFAWQPGATESPEDAARRLLGIEPLDIVHLSDPGSGTRGIAAVLPEPGGLTPTHRVYAGGMLVAEAEPALLPPWAFFVRAVVDTSGLALTASREALQQDDLLDAAREHLGEQLRNWLLRLVAADPTRAARLLEVHQLGARAVAATDDEMLGIVARLLPFETTQGPLTLDEIAARTHLVAATRTVDEFRQVAPLARAIGMLVVEGGHAYDAEIIARYAATRAGIDTVQVSPRDLVARLQPPEPDVLARCQRMLDLARIVLERSGCLVELRAFDPATTPAVLLADAAARRELDRAREAQESDGVWGEMLETLAAPDDQPRFLLNSRNPTVVDLAGVRDDEVMRLGVEALYAQALTTGGHHLRPVDQALLARALPALIDHLIRKD